MLICILMWGMLLRTPELWSGNFLFGHDHGRDYLAAYSIVENHKLTLIGSEAGSGAAGINGIFHGPGYIYLISLAFVLFHGNPVGAQLLMIVFGLLTLLAAGFVSFRIFGKAGSLLFTFFIAVSPLIVSQSRFIWSTHPVTLFIVLALYFVYSIPRNPRLYAPLALFASGLTYHFQLGIAVPLVMGIIVSVLFVYKIRDIRVYLYMIAAVVGAFLPAVLFEFRHNFMAVRSAISYLSGNNGSNSMFEAKRLALHGADYWNNFVNTFTFEFGWIPNGMQKVYLYAAIIPVLSGILHQQPRAHATFIRSLCILIAVTCIGYLFLNNVVWDYYLIHSRIAYILLFTYGITALRNTKTDIRLRTAGIFICTLFLGVVLIGTVFRMYISYTLDLQDNNVYDKIIGKRLVIDTIYSDASGKLFSVFVFMPSVYTWPYDYLFKTYGKQTYGYEPNHEKKGSVYLIIEPDKSQPWRQKGWLETVVQGGTVQWEKVLLNGLILVKKAYN